MSVEVRNLREALRGFVNAAEMFPPETSDAARVYDHLKAKARKVLAGSHPGTDDVIGDDADDFDGEQVVYGRAMPTRTAELAFA